MLFNSFEFFIFFPIVVLLYFVIPKKARLYWLLIASYYFYMCWDRTYALLILTSTLITWGSGLLLARHKRKWVVALSFIINLGILFVFKYFNFTVDNLNLILTKAGGREISASLQLLLPVGISFYTFQALSYTVDVYRGDVEAEHNPFRYALFVSFFPQLVAGPIERSGHLLSQLQEMDQKRLYDWKRIKKGLILMLWGMFLKVVVADRLARYVDMVFNSFKAYGTVELVVAAIFFTFQIYCDFHSYSTIAIGAAEVMGFDIMDNFTAPYLATGIKDFWRRWHISLSLWFRDYLYIPLGGNRKGKLRKYFNIMVVFLTSGLWHGADWTYVIWGGLHGLYQIIGEILMPVRKFVRKLIGVREDSFGFALYQRIWTFALVVFAFIFFRADNIWQADGYIKRMLTQFNPWVLVNGGLYTDTFPISEFRILLVSLVLLLLVDLLWVCRKKRIDAFVEEQGPIFTAVLVIFLVSMLFVFGMYGPAYDAQAFIYFQF